MDDLHFQHPLNVAHRYARAAESFEQILNFEEATTCHQRAIEYLTQAATNCSFPNVSDSLQLQCDFHVNRKNILRLKRIRYQLHRKLIGHKKRQMALEQSQACTLEKNDNNLHWTIFRHIETVDSLLNVLVDSEKDMSNEVKYLSDSSPPDKLPPISGGGDGIKHLKPDTVVIEELHTLNAQLRKFVSQLLNQLNDSQKEVEALKDKLKYYESIYPKSDTINGQIVLDLNSLSSSAESVNNLIQ